MRSYLRKAGMVATLLCAPVIAGAEPPVLNAFSSGTFFLGAGVGSFDVQFLFARAVNNNSFFYQVAGGAWVGLFSVPGTNPTVPAPAPSGNPFTVSPGASAVNREVKFAICQGFTANFADCGTGGLNGPFITSVGSLNTKVISAGDWNTARGGLGFAPLSNIVSVAAFEDTPIPVSDSDFSDMVVGTSLLRTVPEPGTYAMLFVGLAAVALTARRRRQNA